MSFRTTLSQVWFNIQYKLFPFVESRTGNLSEEYRHLISVLEIVRVESHLLPYSPFSNGRPPKDRANIARAFIAKIVLKLTYTKQLISLLESDSQLRVICGWDSDAKIPHKSKFSRAFKEFSENQLPERVHQALIKEAYKNEIVGHIVTDSTPLVARERPLKKEGTRKERKKAANRRYYQEKTGKSLNRRKKQMSQTIEQMTAELPFSCDWGMKKNAQGVTTVWKGYKLHVGIDDRCLPISAILTSASINDCEVAIALMAKSNTLVTSFYDLMDSAYDVPEIKEYSAFLGHVPIIDLHARSAAQKEEKRQEKAKEKLLNFPIAESVRYKNRFSKERFNSLFKEYYGGDGIQYKGHEKVFCHVMFGILAYTAKTLICMVS
jgi:hypothetical protein